MGSGGGGGGGGGLPAKLMKSGIIPPKLTSHFLEDRVRGFRKLK